MKIKPIIYTLFFLVLIKGMSQQTPVLADYYYNTLTLNPAFAGYYENPEVIVSGRSYLNGVEGGPQTLGFTYHTPINERKIGLGGMIIHDKIGVTTKTGIYGAYAFKLHLGYEDYQSDWYYSPHTLSFGLIGGISIYKEDLLSLDLPSDPNFQNNVNAVIPSVGIGFYYSNRNYYIGFSVPNLLEPSLSSSANINIKSNYYFNGGVRLYMSRYLYAEPSILLKYIQGSPFQTDINILLNYNNKFEFGGGFRTSSTFNFLIGLYMSKNWRMIYNFSPTMNNSPLGQTHGFVLNYRFGNGFHNRRD